MSTFNTVLSYYSKFSRWVVIGQIHTPDLKVALNNGLFELKNLQLKSHQALLTCQSSHK